MTALKLIGKHLAIGAASVWGVFTGIFALFSFASGDRVSVAFGIDGASEYSTWELYWTVFSRTVTLEWGTATGGDPDSNTFAYLPGDAVLSTVIDGFLRTAVYLLPAAVLSISIAVVLGLYVALRPNSRLASTWMGSAYLLYAVPSFWVGGILLSFTLDQTLPYSPILFEYVLPTVLVATTLLGGALSYVRAYAIEQASAEFVAFVEAKGASLRRTAIHVLRNAAIPIFSMVFTEAFAVLVLSVFVVAVVFAIEGIGLVVFGAANSGDLPVLFGSVMMIVVAGVFANFLQDLSYGLLDPRVGENG